MNNSKKTNSKSAIVSAIIFLQYIFINEIITSQKDSYASYCSYVSNSCKMLSRFATKRCFNQMPDNFLQSDFESLPSLLTQQTLHFISISNIQNIQQNNRMDHFLYHVLQTNYANKKLLKSIKNFSKLIKTIQN